MKKIYPKTEFRQVLNIRFKQIFDNPVYFFFYLKRLLYLKDSSFKYLEKYQNIKQLSEEKTLEYIIKNNKSIMRFNDGEYGLLTGAGIYYGSSWSQKYSKELKKELIEILKTNDSKILIAITSLRQIFSKSQEINGVYNDKNMHTEMRMEAWKYLNKDQIYGNGMVFALNHHQNFNWQLLKRYLENKNIIIVTGKIKNFKNIRLGKHTYYVETGRPHNAFSKLEKIKRNISCFLNKNKLKNDKTLFMISLGPCAVFIVKYLSSLNYTAWDTGHFFDNYNNKIKSDLMKTP